MIRQTDLRLNRLTNTIMSSDGAALCAMALAQRHHHMRITPRTIRRTLRRWRSLGLIDERLRVKDFGRLHHDLGLGLKDEGRDVPKWRLAPGEIAYAYFTNAHRTQIRCVLMDEAGNDIYDPRGSTSDSRGFYLDGLRIFSTPGVPGEGA